MQTNLALNIFCHFQNIVLHFSVVDVEIEKSCDCRTIQQWSENGSDRRRMRTGISVFRMTWYFPWDAPGENNTSILIFPIIWFEKGSHNRMHVSCFDSFVYFCRSRHARTNSIGQCPFDLRSIQASISRLSIRSVQLTNRLNSGHIRHGASVTRMGKQWRHGHARKKNGDKFVYLLMANFVHFYFCIC